MEIGENCIIGDLIICVDNMYCGADGSVREALGYNSEGRGFDSRLGNWIFQVS
jgi:hypothetical protein